MLEFIVHEIKKLFDFTWLDALSMNIFRSCLKWVNFMVLLNTSRSDE